MRILLKNLIKPLRDIRLIGRDDLPISGIEYDSRRVKPGMLFTAVSGFKTDGKNFIADAIKNGAVAILCDQPVNIDIPLVIAKSARQALSDIAASFYGYPGQNLFVVGITGTNGKSTSVYLVKKLLETAGYGCGMLNSLVYDVGIRSYKAERTTPEALDVQRYLHEMKEARCTHAVVEVSSHALILKRVENIDFKVGLFTTFSRDHLDFHNTMEEYLAAKKLFLNKLQDENKRVVIGLDVPEFAGFIPDARCPVVTYSAAGRKADVTARTIELTAGSSRFELTSRQESKKVSMRLLGQYNVTNAAGVAATGVALGFNLEQIAGALEAAEPIPGRFRPVSLGQPFAVLVDYAHTPDAIERLCQSAREITRGRVMILFGCGGDRDRGKRPLMGQVASRLSDYTVVTSDNPRTEDPLKIIDDIKPGLSGTNYVIIPDRREAIRDIIGRARENDTILIAGKGAEDYQEIGTVKYPYDDTSEVIGALEGLGYGKAKDR